MIVYLDTSAFLKLYLEEAGSDRVRRVVDKAVAVCAHMITYAEMRAGFAQAMHMKRLSETDRAYQLECFEADWATLHVIAVEEPLVRRAGEHAERFHLRGYDSVHLAAAEVVWRQAPGNFRLAAFDRHLVEAGQALGMTALKRDR